MRTPLPRSRFSRTVAVAGAAALLLAACGGDDDADTTAEATGDATASADEGDAAEPDVDGPVITVGSFNFGESQILGNIYGQALEDAGYEVEYQLDLGSREVILPELQSGNIDLLPEYLGSALSVGFGGEPTGDEAETLDLLVAAFADLGVEVLEPAPGQDANAFVVAGDFAEANGLTDIADLESLDTVTFGGPPECADRATCLLGLTETYGLDNIAFEDIAEGSVRVASLREGQIDMALLFSTQPVIAQEGFVALEDSQGIVPVENIVPVVSSEVFEAYGADLAAVLDPVSAAITTEVLIDLNGRFELDAEDADDIAAAFLSENGLVG